MSVVGGAEGTFGGLLRIHRKRAGLSQEQLAERAKLSARAIRNLEASRTGRPRPRTVDLLADAFALRGADRRRFTAWALRQTESTVDDSAPPGLTAAATAAIDQLLASAAVGLVAPLPPRTRTTLDAELDTIRRILEWCGRHDRIRGLRLVTALSTYWFLCLRQAEAACWLERLLPERGPHPVRTTSASVAATLSAAHRYASVCLLVTGHHARSYEHARLAVVFAERVGVDTVVGPARLALGKILFKRGNLTGGERHLRAAFAMTVDYGHWSAVLAADSLADLLSARGDLAEAGRFAERARSVAVRHGLAVLPWAWHALTRTAWRAGDAVATVTAATQMLRSCDAIGGSATLRVRALVYTAIGLAAQSRTGEARDALAAAHRHAGQVTVALDSTGCTVAIGTADRALLRWAAAEVNRAPTEDGCPHPRAGR